jgi:hypothetical protein
MARCPPVRTGKEEAEENAAEKAERRATSMSDAPLHLVGLVGFVIDGCLLSDCSRSGLVYDPSAIHGPTRKEVDDLPVGYTNEAPELDSEASLVPPQGFEPWTYGLRIHRSNQLS